MAIVASVNVSEAQRMLKIVAKLVVGLAKALAPTVICHELWTMGIGKLVPKLGSAVSPTITASATSPVLGVSTQHWMMNLLLLLWCLRYNN